MDDLTDRYVLANVFGCGIALAVHVALLTGGMTSVVPAFAMFAPTFVCFLATMATHPGANVTRIGPVVVSARLDWPTVLRTTPKWSLAITLLFIVYLGWLYVAHRASTSGDGGLPRFATLFAGVCAHLLWSGVGTRLGALRLLRERAALRASGTE